MLNDHLSETQLKAALKEHWRVDVQLHTRLDLNVSRIDLVDGTSWVVRVYPVRKNVNVYTIVNSLAKLLDYLVSQGYPAEHPSSTSPVAELVASDLEKENNGTCILVTRFAPGLHPERNRITFYRLGRLLGRLHSMPVPVGTCEGGAWHHLCLQGGLGDECDAALLLLDNVEHHDEEAQVEALEKLKDKLQHLKQRFVHVELPLPRALVHPDLVPINVVVGADLVRDDKGNEGESWTVVDWTGAGVGTRVLSLGFLLAVAAARGKLVLVNAVMKGYMEFSKLEPGELDRLTEAVWARFFTIQCWEVGVGKKQAVEVVDALPRLIQDAENVTKRVQELT
jgi:Ser/Thr protein kinase RdoA (MazF antagonist)